MNLTYEEYIEEHGIEPECENCIRQDRETGECDLEASGIECDIEADFEGY